MTCDQQTVTIEPIGPLTTTSHVLLGSTDPRHTSLVAVHVWNVTVKRRRSSWRLIWDLDTFYLPVLFLT